MLILVWLFGIFLAVALGGCVAIWAALTTLFWMDAEELTLRDVFKIQWQFVKKLRERV